MGGHSHAEGHHGHHDHHHHAPRINKSLISYEIPDPGHHVDDFKAPDWRKHQVKNAPELVKVQKRLAVLGLKDPWLRYLSSIYFKYEFILFYFSETKCGVMIHNLALFQQELCL